MTDANPRAISTEAPLDEPPSPKHWIWWDWLVAIFFFVSTAAVVLWQNTRFAVLWDLSYILENSYRISLGDIPYRDFVLPYAPLTFLGQAALIKFTGKIFFHHVIYCAVVGGLATVISWRIIFNILRKATKAARLIAFLLSVSLIVLGIYSIFPQPFYDPDCTFTILLCVILLQNLERRRFPTLPAFVVGAILVVPVFVKQNAGLAFLASAALALLVLIALGKWRDLPIRGYMWIVAGSFSGMIAAILIIHWTAGLANYAHWTIQFAASRRLPPLRDMLGIYENNLLPVWIVLFAAGATLSRYNGRNSRAVASLAILLMSSPFAWASIYLIVNTDSSERAERLLAVWPVLLIISFSFAILTFRRTANFAAVLPFILIATVHGAFLSQQLWGSTYAIWPLLIILLAGVIAGLSDILEKRPAWEVVALTSSLTLSLTIAGAFYARSHERLDYANISEGESTRSNLPALAGLFVRGPWMPQFEELVRYTDLNIPRGDALLMIPGEDLFYYATGRHPQFPVLMFDHTVNPYSPEEILSAARARQIQWLIVKRDLQLDQDPVEQKDRVLQLLQEDFTHVESLDNYDIYQRKAPGSNAP